MLPHESRSQVSNPPERKLALSSTPPVEGRLLPSVVISPQPTVLVSADERSIVLLAALRAEQRNQRASDCA